MTGCHGRLGAMSLAVVCLQLVGCATLQFPWDDSVPHASARNPVVQIVCLWEPGEGKGPDGKSCRGFAGQLIFLGNKGGTPVAVDGSVRIKEYDQISGLSDDDNEPFHQFDFEKKVWALHLHTGTLGPTYNVFIPYMRKGNHDAECELVVEYTPDKGTMVSSTVTSLSLRAKHSPKEAAAAQAAAAIIPHTPQVATNRARTTTISLDGRNQTDGAVVAKDPTEARLERMGRIMQDFAAQQSTKSPQVTESEVAAAPVAPGRRFALGDRPAANTNIVQAAAAEIAAENAAAPSRPARQQLLSAHPLAMEDGPTETRSTNVAQRPGARHPLADEPAFAKNGVPQHRNAPPATLVVPAELTDAPAWTRDENTAGQATLDDGLDGKTSQVQ